MAYRQKRKIIGVGGNSKGITLPKPWLDFLGPDVHTVTLFGNDVLIVAPPGLEWKAKKMLEYAGRVKK